MKSKTFSLSPCEFKRRHIPVPVPVPGREERKAPLEVRCIIPGNVGWEDGMACESGTGQDGVDNGNYITHCHAKFTVHDYMNGQDNTCTSGGTTMLSSVLLVLSLPS